MLVLCIQDSDSTIVYILQCLAHMYSLNCHRHDPVLKTDISDIIVIKKKML